MACGSVRSEFHADVGVGSDLFRDLRQRRAARCRCGQRSARMVAPGDLPALGLRPMTKRPILTAEAMRDAEQAAIDQGTSVERLMERAGAALAEAAYRFAGPVSALILCGPGNNGGDGYVAARRLAERGVRVRVAAVSEPKSEAAKWARSQWQGAIETLSNETRAEPLVIDALFGTGLKRGL